MDADDQLIETIQTVIDSYLDQLGPEEGIDTYDLAENVALSLKLSGPV